MKRKLIAIFLSLALLMGLIIPGDFSMVSAENISQSGEETSTIPGNIMKNPEFDNNEFGEMYAWSMWYPNNSTISQDNTNTFAGGNSMKISNRQAFWSRAEYREWFGNLSYDKDYYLQGAVSASSAASLELHMDVICWGGPSNDPYPMVSLTMDTVAVDGDVWRVLSGSVKFTSQPSATEGKVDVSVHFGGTTQVIKEVNGIDCLQIFVQQAYNVDTVFPDLYMDSFLLKEGKGPHDEGKNTEEITVNKILNSSFETNDFGTDHQFAKWYSNPYVGGTISQVNNYSHSGRYSLKVSNRSDATSRVQYREWFGNLVDGKDYNLSGYVSAASQTSVELVAVVWGYGGTVDAYPSVVMTLDSDTANSADWTQLKGKFNISTAPSATEGKKDATITWGGQSQTMTAVSGVDCIEFYIQQTNGVTSYPDLYIDSFLMQEDSVDLTVGGGDTKTDAINVTVVDNMELPTGYVQGKYIFGWTYDGTVQTKFDMTNNIELYEADFVDTKMLQVRRQDNSLTAGESAETLNLRVIGSVNNLDCDEVGFVLSLSNSEPTLDGADCVKRSTTTVYKNLNAAGTPQHVNDVYGKYSEYMYAFEITNIPALGEGTVIYARSYVKRGDTYVYGDAEKLQVPEEKTLKILTIGNSFADDAMAHAWQVATALGEENVYIGSLYIGGCDLKTHLSCAMNDTASYVYRTNSAGVWNNQPDYKMKDALLETDWDYISIQQSSAESGKAATYEASLDDLVSYVKEKVPTAKLIYHMTWAYQGDTTQIAFNDYTNDQMTMYNAILDCVQQYVVPDRRFVKVIPNATSIQNLRTTYLGDTICRDGYHLADLGRYTAAVTFIHTLTGADIDQLTWKPSGISEQERLIAIESAKNAVANPYKVTNSVYTTAP